MRRAIEQAQFTKARDAGAGDDQMIVQMNAELVRGAGDAVRHRDIVTAGAELSAGMVVH